MFAARSIHHTVLVLRVCQKARGARTSLSENCFSGWHRVSGLCFYVQQFCCFAPWICLLNDSRPKIPAPSKVFVVLPNGGCITPEVFSLSSAPVNRQKMSGSVTCIQSKLGLIHVPWVEYSQRRNNYLLLLHWLAPDETFCNGSNVWLRKYQMMSRSWAAGKSWKI